MAVIVHSDRLQLISNFIFLFRDYIAILEMRLSQQIIISYTDPQNRKINSILSFYLFNAHRLYCKF